MEIDKVLMGIGLVATWSAFGVVQFSDPHAGVFATVNNQITYAGMAVLLCGVALLVIGLTKKK